MLKSNVRFVKFGSELLKLLDGNFPPIIAVSEEVEFGLLSAFLTSKH